MDNRTGVRQTRTIPRGPAARAAAARRALGIGEDAFKHTIGAVPAPFVHAALGFAACAVATVLRPQAAGLAGSVVGAAVIAVAVGLAIILFDRKLVLPVRPPLEVVALPMAAVVSYVTLLGESNGALLRGVGAVLAGTAIAVVPQLAARSEQVLRGRWWFEALRDALAIAVLVPALLAGASTDQSLWLRALITAAVSLPVALETIRIEVSSRRRTAGFGALFVAGGTILAAIYPSGAGSEIHTGLTLLTWYGLRGLAVSYLAGRRGMTMVLEYIGVVCAAAIVLSVVQG